jgi:hypothetical protein
MGGCVSSTAADISDFAAPPITGGGHACKDDGKQWAASSDSTDGSAIIKARDQDSAAASASGAAEYAAAGKPVLGCTGRVGSLTLTRMRSTTRAALHLEFLSEIQGLQQQMALVNDNALMGLQEAAELLATQLGADLIA